MEITKKKKTLLLGITCLVLIGIGTLLHNRNIENNTKDVVLCAKIDEYNSAEELRNASDIVVAGVKSSESDSTFVYSADGETLLCAYTLSDFTISETLEGTKDSNISKTIKVLENEFYDAETDTNYHIAGYSKMIINKPYVLYLTYSEENDWYIPTGVITGKIPVDEKEEVIVDDIEKSSKENVEKVISSVRNTYDFDSIKNKCKK